MSIYPVLHSQLGTKFLVVLVNPQVPVHEVAEIQVTHGYTQAVHTVAEVSQ